MNERQPPTQSKAVRKRAAWMAVVGALIVAGAAIGIRYSVKSAELNAKRAAAMEMLKADSRDVELAIQNLQLVVQHRPKDVEAIASIARAFLRRSPPARQNVIESVRCYTNLLQLDANRATDRYEAVRLLDSLGESDALVQLIEPLIQTRPADAMLHELKTIHLMRLSRTKDAEHAAKAWCDAATSSFRAQFAYASFLAVAGEDQTNPDSRLSKFISAIPNQDLASVVRATLFAQGKRPQEAAGAIDATLQKPNFDVGLTRPLVTLLAQLGRDSEADQLLQRAIEKNTDESLITLAALREIDRANYSQALNRLTSAPRPAEASARTSRLCITGFLARKLNRVDDFQSAMTELQEPPTEVSNGWLAVLTATRSEPIDATAARALLPQLRMSPLIEDGGTLQQLAIANCLAAIDQTRAADRTLDAAAHAVVGWGPCARRLIELRRSQNEIVQAIAAAQYAFNRSGHSIDAAIALALTVADSKPEGIQAEKHFQLLTEIQKAIPGEVQTLGLFVDALATRGDPSAKQVLSDAISRASPTRLELLLLWADLSQRHALGLENACIARAEALHGLSPRLALSRALLVHRSGTPGDAFSELLAARTDHPEQKREYDEAVAQFLRATNSPDAQEAWNALASTNPTDTELQIRVLNYGYGGNSQQVRTLIERIRQRDPSNAVAELADIRLSLAAHNGRTTTDAVLLRLNRLVERSPDLMSARVLLIDLLARTNNFRAALSQWDRAIANAPEEPSILLAGARLLIANGDRARATQVMKKVDGLVSNLSTQQREEAARTYLILGVATETIRLLKAVPELPRSGRLLLVEALYRAGQADDARTLLDQLLATPDFDTLLLAAAVEDSQGRRDVAKQLLERARSETEMDDQDRLRVVNFASERGELQQLAGFLASGNVSSEVTIHIASRFIEHGELDVALKVLNDAVGRSRDASVLRARLAEEPQLRQLVSLGLYQVASQLLESPEDAGTRLMVAFAISTQSQSLREQQLSLDRLAASSGENYALQMFLADRFLAANQPVAAEKHARLAAQANPSAPQPFAVAALAMSRANNTGRCAEAIRDWRNRLPADSTQPDAMEALNLDRRQEYTELISRFEPRVAAQLANVPLDVYFALARAMHARGRDQDAIAMLLPLMQSDSRVSAVWCKTVAKDLNITSAMKWIDALGPIVEKRQLPAEAAAFAVASDVVARKSGQATRIYEAGRSLAALEALANELPADSVIALADNRVAQGEAGLAIGILERAIATRQDPSVMEAQLAELLRSEKRLDDALVHIDNAISAAPDNASIRDIQAAILLDQSRVDLALDAAQIAQRLDPLNPLRLLRVASIHQIKGDLVTARSSLETLRWFFRETEAWDDHVIDRFRTFENHFRRQPDQQGGATTSAPAN